MKKQTRICMIGTFISILLFFVICVFQIKDGLARDASIYVYPFISCSLWALLVLCVVSPIVFALLRKRTGMISSIATMLLFVILVLGGFCAIIGWQLSYHSAEQILVFDDTGDAIYEVNPSSASITPRLVLHENRQYSFDNGMEDANVYTGQYKIKGRTLYLEADDNEYKFAFNIKKAALVFDPDASSVPSDFRSILNMEVFSYIRINR